MGLYEYNCLECGKSCTSEGAQRRGDVCFKCHVRGINLGFTYGKENFHGDTVRQKQDKMFADAKANGMTIAPAKDYGF